MARHPVIFAETTGITIGAATTVGDSIEAGAAHVSKPAASVLGHVADWAPPVAAGVMALISQWDHHIEKKRIMREYEPEIAARLGKPMHSVTLDDMEKVARENPALQEAIHNSAKHRNLNIAVAVAGVAAAVGVVALVASPLSGVILGAVGAHAGAAVTLAGIHTTAGTLAGMAAHAIAAGGTFLGVEGVFHEIGAKLFHMKEPDLDQVKRDPRLQGKLSVPKQITYLEQMQAKGEKISQEQVMSVFATANKELSAQIEARYGAKFGDLSQGDKADVVKRLGAEYAIPELTDDINNRHMRAQELAFTAYGQSSGIRSVGDIQRSNVQLRKQNEGLLAQLNQLYAKQQPAVAAPDPSADDAEPEQTTIWRQRIMAERQAGKASAVGA